MGHWEIDDERNRKNIQITTLPAAAERFKALAKEASVTQGLTLDVWLRLSNIVTEAARLDGTFDGISELETFVYAALRNCGLLTDGEIAILLHAARNQDARGALLRIGSALDVCEKRLAQWTIASPEAINAGHPEPVLS